ncbi:MAG: creatininase family protein [Xanthomonadaceae bacterium]|nr:creatininase family protein [Xanthomonadaceae bacterium]
MNLQFSTWPEIEAYLQRSRCIVVPIGSTEQHGPTGMIGTDALCPEIVAAGMAQQRELLIAPTLSIGMAQHHLAFAGTISLRPSTLIRVVVDVVESLAGHGFEHIFFVNGHGGNIATVQAAFSEVWAGASFSGRGSAVKLQLHNWFQGQRVAKLSRELFGDGEGSHATPSEISLVLSVYAEAARDVALDPDIPPTAPIRDARDFRHQHPDGRMGARSNLASAKYGRRLREAAVADALAALKRFVSL